jgi:hypothetical protein
MYSVKNYNNFSHAFTFLAQSIQRKVTGWKARVLFLAGEVFSILYCVQTGSEAHRASYPMGTGGPFLGSKAAEA